MKNEQHDKAQDETAPEANGQEEMSSIFCRCTGPCAEQCSKKSSNSLEAAMLL